MLNESMLALLFEVFAPVLNVSIQVSEFDHVS